ncbi:hypothetical protein [Streptomyces chartreusis]|uniref:hypothetical protein n=1 Tax=Streptomyces chartreusis TaxID=1969 RepID=UPI0036B1CB57
MLSGFLVVLGRSDGPENQATYVQQIIHARQQLFTGQLIHTDVRSLELAAGAESPRLFRVDILGSWRRAKPGEPQVPVSAGAQIGVKLHCSGAGLRCTSLSSERQNVLAKNGGATWVWDVRAQRAGKASFALTVTAYFRETSTVLAEKTPMRSRVDVAAPKGKNHWISWVEALWGWVTGAITSLGGLAVSASAIIAVILTVIRRQLPDAEADADTPEHVGIDRRRPRTRSVPTSRPRLRPARTQPSATGSVRFRRRSEAHRDRE